MILGAGGASAPVQRILLQPPKPEPQGEELRKIFDGIIAPFVKSISGNLLAARS
jgi:hypothetical protein